MSEKVQTKVYLPPDVKAMLDVDRRSNSEIVEDALIQHFGGEKSPAIERRIEEQERAISNLKTERNERDREIAERKERLEGLRKKREKVQQVEERQLEMYAQHVQFTELSSGLSVDSTDKELAELADKAGVDVDELVEAARRMYDNA